MAEPAVLILERIICFHCSAIYFIDHLTGFNSILTITIPAHLFYLYVPHGLLEGAWRVMRRDGNGGARLTRTRLRRHGGTSGATPERIILVFSFN